MTYRVSALMIMAVFSFFNEEQPIIFMAQAGWLTTFLRQRRKREPRQLLKYSPRCKCLADCLRRSAILGQLKQQEVLDSFLLKASSPPFFPLFCYRVMACTPPLCLVLFGTFQQCSCSKGIIKAVENKS